MSYSKSVFKKATQVIETRHNEAVRKSEEKHSQCILLFPEIAEYEKEMIQSSMSVANAIGLKNGAEDYIKNIMKRNLDAQQKISNILKKNNLPSDYFEPVFFCKKCDDTGYRDGVMCECLLEEMKNISYEEMSDKLPVKECSFDNFDVSLYPREIDERTGTPCDKWMKSIFEYSKSYASDFSQNSENLLFCGETGLGKTHLSLAIAGAVSSNGFSTVYSSAQNLMNMLEEEKFSKNSLEISTEKSILNCDLLIIDDLGAEFSTQFTVSALYNIINSRLLSKKPIIISTNLSPKDLESKYSRRITSRIYGNFKYIIFCGKDIRQIKSQY